MTVRHQLNAFKEKTGVTPQLLEEEVQPPHEFRQAIELFLKIIKTRSNTTPLDGLTLKAWCDLYQYQPSPFEVDCIHKMIIAFYNKMAKQEKQ